MPAFARYQDCVKAGKGHVWNTPEPPAGGPVHLKKVPRIQILTIADLFAGKRPDIPMVDSTAFRKAPKEQRQQGTLL